MIYLIIALIVGVIYLLVGAAICLYMHKFSLLIFFGWPLILLFGLFGNIG